MYIDIYFLSNIISSIAGFITLIIACFCCYRKGVPGYLKIFPVYLFVSDGIELFANRPLITLFKFHFSPEQLLLRFPIYNLFTVFETLAFSYFLFLIIRSRQIKKISFLLLALFLLFFIQSSLKDGLQHTNDLAVVFESIIIVILCLTFFRELFTRSEPIDLLKEPSFWLVTGIFFYLTVIFPLFLADSYLKSHGLIKVAQGLYSINNFALCVTYLLFIKGFTCRTRKL
jgi:hypothetical protein